MPHPLSPIYWVFGEFSWFPFLSTCSCLEFGIFPILMVSVSLSVAWISSWRTLNSINFHLLALSEVKTHKRWRIWVRDEADNGGNCQNMECFFFWPPLLFVFRFLSTTQPTNGFSSYFRNFQMMKIIVCSFLTQRWFDEKVATTHTKSTLGVVF